MKCSGLQKSRQTSWKIQLLKSKNVQSSFYPTTPVTTVQESVQWENSCLVIFHKVSSLDSCIFSFRRSERFVIIHLKNYRFHLQIIFIFINYPNQVNFRVQRGLIYRVDTCSSASIAWSNSLLTSWFEHSGNLDGDSVSPYPRMPGTCRVFSGAFIWWWLTSRQDFILFASLT